MNDRFKFRVWDKKHNEYIPSNMIGTLLYFGHRDEFHIEFECFSTFADSLIIEQCTGLKDKNGKPIYENDLIIAPNNSHKLAVIRMENGVYGCKECRFNGVWEMNLYDLIKHYGVEIVGNIHEQAEQKESK